MTGSNRRHPGCKPDTLPTELTEQKIRLLFALSAASHLQVSRELKFSFGAVTQALRSPMAYKQQKWWRMTESNCQSLDANQKLSHLTNPPNKAWAIFHHDRLHFLAYRLHARNHATRLLSVMPPRNTTYSVRPHMTGTVIPIRTNPLTAAMFSVSYF